MTNMEGAQNLMEGGLVDDIPLPFPVVVEDGPWERAFLGSAPSGI